MLLTSLVLIAPSSQDRLIVALNLGGILNNSLIKVFMFHANFNPSSFFSTIGLFFTSSSPFSFKSCLTIFTNVWVHVPTYNNLKNNKKISFKTNSQ